MNFAKREDCRVPRNTILDDFPQITIRITLALLLRGAHEASRPLEAKSCGTFSPLPN
jgi:hypothetical protein